MHYEFLNLADPSETLREYAQRRLFHELWDGFGPNVLLFSALTLMDAVGVEERIAKWAASRMYHFDMATVVEWIDSLPERDTPLCDLPGYQRITTRRYLPDEGMVHPQPEDFRIPDNLDPEPLPAYWVGENPPEGLPDSEFDA